jgi:undecaprenyl-diphosphatase
MDGVDWGTWYQFHDWRLGLPVWTGFFQQVRWLGSASLLLLVGLVLLVWLARQRTLRRSLVFLLMIFIALLLGVAGNRLVPRERPPDWDGRFGQGGSFPSMEALFSLVFYGGGAWLSTQGATRWWPRGVALVGSALLILLLGTSQLYCGDHFLSDVLAGWAAGLAAVLAGRGLETALAARSPAAPPQNGSSALR